MSTELLERWRLVDEWRKNVNVSFLYSERSIKHQQSVNKASLLEYKISLGAILQMSKAASPIFYI